MSTASVGIRASKRVEAAAPFSVDAAYNDVGNKRMVVTGTGFQSFAGADFFLENMFLNNSDYIFPFEQPSATLARENSTTAYFPYNDVNSKYSSFSAWREGGTQAIERFASLDVFFDNGWTASDPGTASFSEVRAQNVCVPTNIRYNYQEGVIQIVGYNFPPPDDMVGLEVIESGFYINATRDGTNTELTPVDNPTDFVSEWISSEEIRIYLSESHRTALNTQYSGVGTAGISILGPGFSDFLFKQGNHPATRVYDVTFVATVNPDTGWALGFSIQGSGPVAPLGTNVTGPDYWYTEVLPVQFEYNPNFASALTPRNILPAYVPNGAGTEYILRANDTGKPNANWSLATGASYLQVELIEGAVPSNITLELIGYGIGGGTEGTLTITAGTPYQHRFCPIPLTGNPWNGLKVTVSNGASLPAIFRVSKILTGD